VRKILRWTEEAERKIAKVPFFIRSFVRKVVEEEAIKQGQTIITPALINASKQSFFNRKRKEETVFEEPNSYQTAGEKLTPQELENFVKWAEQAAEERWVKNRFYEIRVCASSVGCPFAIINAETIKQKLLPLIEASNLIAWLETRIKGAVLSHHRFKIAIAGCPNACSEPQTKDFGLIGQATVCRGKGSCIECLRCVEHCREDAIQIIDGEPRIDYRKCVRCGGARVCPSQALQIGQVGFKVLVGGKLGRHPKLAETLAELVDETEVLTIFRNSLTFYMTEARDEERFATLVDRLGISAVKSKLEIAS
jgi:dissimilatory sulfite reductase (desulfoviridin) alpha/beta subunit